MPPSTFQPGDLIVTSFDAGNTQDWHIATLDKQSILDHVEVDYWSPLVKVVARLPDDTDVPAKTPTPLRALTAFCPAIYEAVLLSGRPGHTITRIIINLDNLGQLEGLIPIIGYVDKYKEIKHADGTIEPMGMITRNAFYNYFRIAEVAQKLGMRSIVKETTGRIRGMLYKEDSKSWGVAISDLKLIYTNISNSQHWIRYHISKSLALSANAGVLRNQQAIEEVLKNEIPDVHAEIKEIAER